MDQVAEAETPYSADWWEERTSEQLQEMVRAGLGAGEYGAGAIRELERRARKHAAVQEREAEVLVALLIAMGAVLLMR